MADFELQKNKVNFKNFLGVKDVIPDLKSLPKKFIFFMIVACLIIIFFNFFNVQGASRGWYDNPTLKTGWHDGWFLPLSTYHSVLDRTGLSTFGQNKSGAIVTAVLYSLNGLASFTGIIAVSMISFNKKTQYFWGVINAVFFGLFAISVGYLGDLIMQVIIILCCPLGWYLFEKALMNPNHNQKKTWKFNVAFFVGVGVMITIVTLVLYEFLPQAFHDTFGKLNDAVNPYTGKYHDGSLSTSDNTNPLAERVLDSMGNGFNFVGYILQLVNFDEQMYVWIFNDTIKLLKFTGISGKNSLSINMLIQFAVWISLDVIGIYNRLFKTWADKTWIKVKIIFKRK